MRRHNVKDFILISFLFATYVLKCAAATVCRIKVFPSRHRCDDSCGRRLLKGRKFETLGRLIGGGGDQRSGSGGVLMEARRLFLSAAD